MVCYCKSGQRNRFAAQLLKDSGFTQVSSLQRRHAYLDRFHRPFG
nr:rhodanese-like domain-containing protein [Candidatus Coxiella mudrowiae]